ncbi:MAG: universal stress protein, partial [Deltaproteobacteria bacterium]|nr:universal stress protein [Deltaproteobacteria bacterium]
MQLRNIVCPIDGSELTGKVLNAAAYLGKVSDARIILVNVVERWDKAQPLVTDSKEWQAIHEGWLKEGKELLEKEAGKLKKMGVKHVDTVLSDGDAAYEIIALANERSADLIVMATHRY